MNEKIVYDPTKDLQASVPQTTEKVKAKKPEKTKAKKTAKSPKNEPKLKQDHVNAYGFIHLSKEIAKAFGAPRDVNTPITIEVKDGVLMVRKA